MPRWITIAGRKGGVGKTSCSLALAAHYVRAGKSVLRVCCPP
jgi:cellulose biosynthesis protein BcsQ